MNPMQTGFYPQMQMCKAEIDKVLNYYTSNRMISTEQANNLRNNYNSWFNAVWTEWYSTNFNMNYLNSIIQKYVYQFSTPSTFFSPTVNMGNAFSQSNSYMTAAAPMMNSNPSFNPMSHAQDLWGNQNNFNVSQLPSNTQKNAKISQEQQATNIKVSQDAMGDLVNKSSSVISAPIVDTTATPSAVKIIPLPKNHGLTEERDKKISEYINRVKVFKIQINTREVMMNEISLADPMNNIEHTISEVEDSFPEAVNVPEFCTAVKYGELHILKKDAPYVSSIKFMDEFCDKYAKVKENISNLPVLIHELNAGGILGQKLKRYAYYLFNEYSSVFLVKKCSDGMYHGMRPIVEDVDVNYYMDDDVSDRGDFSHELKGLNEEDRKIYVSRLGALISKSFGSLFDKDDSIKYLDMGNTYHRQYVLTSGKVGYRFGKDNFCSRTVQMFTDIDEDGLLNKSIGDKLYEIFPMIFSNKIFYHNLNLNVPEWYDTGVNFVSISNTSAIFDKLMEINNNVMVTVDANDHTQIKHLILIGKTYEDVLICRRMS